MHIATAKQPKTAPLDTLNKIGTQQKKHPLMPFENNRTLKRWHMINTPPEIDKYGTHIKWCLTKLPYLAKNNTKIIWHGLR